MEDVCPAASPPLLIAAPNSALSDSASPIGPSLGGSANQAAPLSPGHGMGLPYPISHYVSIITFLS